MKLIDRRKKPGNEEVDNSSRYQDALVSVVLVNGNERGIRLQNSGGRSTELGCGSSNVVHAL